MGTAQHTAVDEARVRQILATIPDPEIPVISIVDLGIVRSVVCDASGVEVGLTSTYSGCPATDVIRGTVLETLQAHGVRARVRMILNPPWSTDWISVPGRAQLAAYGIVPPRWLHGTHGKATQINDEPVACPRCQSLETELTSEFGATPCKALYRCRSCLEPFERFKCL
jgi:ring-1,2-phenylacetyl-CoA epoxidase subunit PaaD